MAAAAVRCGGPVPYVCCVALTPRARQPPGMPPCTVAPLYSYSYPRLAQGCAYGGFYRDSLQRVPLICTSPLFCIYILARPGSQRSFCCACASRPTAHMRPVAWVLSADGAAGTYRRIQPENVYIDVSPTCMSSVAQPSMHTRPHSDPIHVSTKACAAARDDHDVRPQQSLKVRKPLPAFIQRADAVSPGLEATCRMAVMASV